MSAVCKYFSTKTGCHYGDKCRYSHNNNRSNPMSNNHNICKLFLAKKCKYGNQCKFQHIAANNGTSLKYQKNKHQNNSRKYVNKNERKNRNETPSGSSSNCKPKICRKYLQNNCRYGNNCKYLHNKQHKTNHNKSPKKTGSQLIRFDELGIGLKYNRFIKQDEIERDNKINTLYYYRIKEKQRLCFMYLLYEYRTNIFAESIKESHCEYICGVIKGKYLLVQNNNIIYKLKQYKNSIIDDGVIFDYKCIDQIELLNYDENISKLVSLSDELQNIYSLHDLCICSTNSDYLMSYSLYGVTCDEMECVIPTIKDIQIFNISDNNKQNMECIYNIKNEIYDYNCFGHKISFGEFYWYNENILFYTEYGSDNKNGTGLGKFCVAYDMKRFNKKTRNILNNHLNHIESLIDVIYDFLGCFDYIFNKKEIFGQVKLIEMNKSLGAIYVQHFNKKHLNLSHSKQLKQYGKGNMHSYQILSL